MIAAAFVTNIALFLIAEVLVLCLGLLLAVLRGLPGPVFFPIRLVAVAYADIFRGIPSLLIIFVLGLRDRRPGPPGRAQRSVLLARSSLTLVYSAYVSEVYRAGIESIHPSQAAAARSLGLTRFQALRYVVIPQAVRRVIPPLLNDFIGLQKDTVLVSYHRRRRGVPDRQHRAAGRTSTSRRTWPCRSIFLVITIPLTRLTD